MTSFWSWKLFL
jgi:hypothetical protein